MTDKEKREIRELIAKGKELCNEMRKVTQKMNDLYGISCNIEPGDNLVYEYNLHTSNPVDVLCFHGIEKILEATGCNAEVTKTGNDEYPKEQACIYDGNTIIHQLSMKNGKFEEAYFDERTATNED